MRTTWKRAREIFNDPRPPSEVWEQQFDGFDDDLRRMAVTPWDRFNFDDMWFYHHDLAYVDLQPDLFNYLFPICLMDWHFTLQANRHCSHGDSEFHYGIRRGNVLQKMMNASRRRLVYEFFRDSFLDRLDQERGFVYAAAETPAFGWMSRFNSVGLVMPEISLLWDSWWELELPGHAVAALEYCSGLMYFDGENPIFRVWTREAGGGGPYLWGNDTHILDSGWLPRNIEFLKQTLTVDFVNAKIHQAVERLDGEPEYARAAAMRDDLADRQELIVSRVAELPKRLKDPNRHDTWLV